MVSLICMHFAKNTDYIRDEDSALACERKATTKKRFPFCMKTYTYVDIANCYRSNGGR